MKYSSVVKLLPSIIKVLNLMPKDQEEKEKTLRNKTKERVLAIPLTAVAIFLKSVGNR